MVRLNYVLIKLLGFFFLSKRILTNDTDLLWTRKFQCMLLSIKLCSYDVSWPKYAPAKRSFFQLYTSMYFPWKWSFSTVYIYASTFSARFTINKGTVTRAFQSLLIVCQTFLAPEQSIYFTFSYQFLIQKVGRNFKKLILVSNETLTLSEKHTESIEKKPEVEILASLFLFGLLGECTVLNNYWDSVLCWTTFGTVCNDLELSEFQKCVPIQEAPQFY